MVYAVWAEDPRGRWFDPSIVVTHPLANVVLKFAAANLPGAALGEFAVSGSLAAPLSQVHPSELPIALALDLTTVREGTDIHGEWRFEFLGQSDEFGKIWQIPADVQPVAPTPLTFEQLNQGAEDMLRESLGLPPDVPIPVPQGALPPEEHPEEPYRFDPTRHMDLSMAEAPPPLPPPKEPGPEPAPGAAIYGGPALQPTQDKQHGAFGDASVPFAH
ncbi:MAG TPA: hypothetical protein VHU24_03230 [Solirubrobacterales bacterium]|nr:hypothetical protein [Solirubrobacterales bacterium]